MQIKAKSECRSCFIKHMGAWAIVPDILDHAVSEYMEGRLVAAFEPGADIEDNVSTSTIDGVAIVSLTGAMMKGRSKFGDEFSTVDARRHIREIGQDSSVKAALLRIDSPGGHVDGTAELAADIDALAAKKPVHVFAEDMMASAGYWIAAGANRITSNEMAQVGSIGVFAVLYDRSKQFEKRGITVHRVATGDLKGTGAPGTEISAEALSEYGEIINHYGTAFFGRVEGKRRIESAAMEEIKRGGIFTAPKAKSLGLIDGIETFDQAFESAREAGAVAARRERFKRGY
jgi:signal peptide peptidase SppA